MIRFWFYSAMKITAKKATSTNQDVVKEKDEGNTNKITTLKVYFNIVIIFLYVLPSCISHYFETSFLESKSKTTANSQKAKAKGTSGSNNRFRRW